MSTEKNPRGEAGELNVIFHGTFFFACGKRHVLNDNGQVEVVDKEGGYRVLIPNIHHHVYRIGNWLGEISLQGQTAPANSAHAPQAHAHTEAPVEAPGAHPHHPEQPPPECTEPDHHKLENTLSENSHHEKLPEDGILFPGYDPATGPPVFELKGVDPGNQKLSPKYNLLFPRTQPLAGNLNSTLRAVLLLPKPKSISTTLRVAIPFASDAQGLPPDYEGQVGTLQIFTYHFQDDAALKLAGSRGNQFWEPIFSGDTVNLHIYAEPETDQGLSHSLEAFQALTSLVVGVDLPLPRTRLQSSLDEDKLPEGVVSEEMEDLAPRITRLSQLGRMHKESRDLNRTWFRSEAFGEEPPACCGAGRDGDGES